MADMIVEGKGFKSSSSVVRGPLVINSKMLAPLVEAAFGCQSVGIQEWAVQQLQGGSGRQAQVYRVRGKARAGVETLTWSLILKSIKRSEAHVAPDGIHFWKREPLVYACGLLDTISGGLRAPQCLGLVERPDDKIWLWLEDVARPSGDAWTWPRYGLAARHLGQFNGAYLDGLPCSPPPWLGWNWLRSWVADVTVTCDQLPRYRQHPLIRQLYPGFMLDELWRLWTERERLLNALDELPQTFCHRDARYTAASNLFSRSLTGRAPQTVAIDWAYAGIGAVGEDLAPFIGAPLAFGELTPKQVETLERVAFDAYEAGMQEVGCHLDRDQLRFGYTAALVLRYWLRGLDVAIRQLARDADGQADLSTTSGQAMALRLAAWRQPQAFLYARAQEAQQLLCRVT